MGSWTLLVMVVTLGMSMYAVQRLRISAVDRTDSPVASGRDTPGPTTRAEVVTVAVTVLATLLVWPMVAWMADNVRGELRNGHARPAFITFYACVALLPPLAGGGLGWLRARYRHRSGLALWRSTAVGVLTAELLVFLAAVAFFFILGHALAHSGWQF
jgi:hypothetical protein